MEQTIGKSVMPFKIQHLVTTIMQKKTCGFEDALLYLYPSDLYKQLTDESSILWTYSTLSLYDLLKKEKSKKRFQELDSKVLLFCIFCLENYTEEKKMMPADTLQLFLLRDVFGYLEQAYEMLHTQSKEYILSEIDIYIKKSSRL